MPGGCPPRTAVHVVEGADVVDVRSWSGHSVTDDAEVEGSACRTCSEAEVVVVVVLAGS